MHDFIFGTYKRKSWLAEIMALQFYIFIEKMKCNIKVKQKSTFIFYLTIYLDENYQKIYNFQKIDFKTQII